MRLSRYFLPVLKETPSEAQIVSHRLMLRAGMIKQSSAGIYSWLPLGFKVLKRIEQIVHEEQIRAGHIPMLMPTLQSADLWQKSGRYDAYGPEMLRLKDRHDRDMLYGPTNEEMITDMVGTFVTSYKSLPLTLYHIQWKFRDEVRPRFGVMRGREFLMKDGYNFDLTKEAALLEERDLAGRSAGADMQERVRMLRGSGPRQGVDTARVISITKSVSRLAGGFERPQAMPTDDEVGRVLAQAYPDRIARKRRGEAPRYQLSNGRGAALRSDDRLARYEWLVAAELDGKAREATIYLAAPVTPAVLEQDLSGHIEEYEEAVWDERRGTVVARRVRKLGQLELEETALPAPSPELVQQGLLAAVRKKGLGSLPWTPAAEQWLARVTLLAEYFPGEWPTVSERWLTDNLDTWLGPFLAGMTHWRDLDKLNLSQALASLLAYPQQQALEELAPPRLTIPTGQSVALDYTAENGPVLAAKLQALFGWTKTPTVAGGQVPVVIHLLSPAQRPLAVTADLASFWQNAYPEVRKDMRGRYPKHPWPEDPLTADASQGTKKRPPRSIGKG